MGEKKKKLFWRRHHFPACEGYFCYEKASLWNLVGGKIIEIFKARNILSPGALAYSRGRASKMHPTGMSQREHRETASGFFWELWWTEDWVSWWTEDWGIYPGGLRTGASVSRFSSASSGESILVILLLSGQASGLLMLLIPGRFQNLLPWVSHSTGQFIYF